MKIYLCKKCELVSTKKEGICPCCKSVDTHYEFNSEMYYDLTEKQEYSLTSIILESEDFKNKSTEWVKGNPLIALLLVNAIDNGYTFLFSKDDNDKIFINTQDGNLYNSNLYVPNSNKFYSSDVLLGLFSNNLKKILNKELIIPAMEFQGIDFTFLAVKEPDINGSDDFDIMLEMLDHHVSDNIYDIISLNPDILTDKLDAIFTIR